MTGRGRTSHKTIQETLAHLRSQPCLLNDLILFERLKRWTVDAFWRIHPPDDRTTTFRHLEQLVELGCLGKHAAAGKEGGGSRPAVYYLSALGARVLTHALERAQPVTYVRPDSRTQEAHDLALTELAVDWWLFDPAWQVQTPVSYPRNYALLEPARKYLDELAAWREWQEIGPQWQAAQKEVETLRSRLQSLSWTIGDIEGQWKRCIEREGHSRASAELREEIAELRAQQEQLERFRLPEAEAKLQALPKPPSVHSEPALPWTLQSAYETQVRPGQSPEGWAAALQPDLAQFIPDFHARFQRPGRSDWLVCIEVEARTERRHIADKYRRYAIADRALGQQVLLSLYVVFTSRQVARQALPKHRSVLNGMLREPGLWVYTVSFTDLDHLRTLEGEGTAAELLQKGMQQTWEALLEDGKWKGDLHKAYEQEWEKRERRRRERDRRAYWAARRRG